MMWDEFREVCEMDARNWADSEWRSDELTIDDILNEYPEDYFCDSPDDEYDDLSSFFTQEEFGAETLRRIKSIEEEEEEE